MRLYDNDTCARSNIIRSVTRVPGADYLDLSDVKSHLRVDFSTEDSYIQILISAARAAIESYTQASIVVSAVTVAMVNQISPFLLPWGPYRDTLVVKNNQDIALNGDQFSISGDYLTQSAYDDIKITYNAGYDITTLPADLKLAVFNQVAHLYTNRGDQKLSESAKALAAPYKRNAYI